MCHTLRRSWSSRVKRRKLSAKKWNAKLNSTKFFSSLWKRFRFPHASNCNISSYILPLPCRYLRLIDDSNDRSGYSAKRGTFFTRNSWNRKSFRLYYTYLRRRGSILRDFSPVYEAPLSSFLPATGRHFRSCFGQRWNPCGNRRTALKQWETVSRSRRNFHEEEDNFCRFVSLLSVLESTNWLWHKVSTRATSYFPTLKW